MTNFMDFVTITAAFVAANLLTDYLRAKFTKKVKRGRPAGKKNNKPADAAGIGA